MCNEMHKRNACQDFLIGLNYSLSTICLIINATGPSANQPRSLCWAHMLIIVNCNLPLNPPIWALHESFEIGLAEEGLSVQKILKELGFLR